MHLPGTKLIVLDGKLKDAGEVEVVAYLESEGAYRVSWTYEQTGEKEFIIVPEWRLMKRGGKEINLFNQFKM
jgi:dTDP-4-dehydrorhamnose reductase